MDGTLTTENPTVSPLKSETSVNPPSENTVSIEPQLTQNVKQTLLGDPDGRSTNPTVWKPGQSGNPLGRPRGSKNKITLLKLSLEESLREDAADHMHEVLQTAIRLAKKGHPGMIKLLLELHMSKSGDTDDRTVDDKITININQMGDQPIVIEGNKNDAEV